MRKLAGPEYDLLIPKVVAQNINPEDVMGEYCDPRQLLEVMKSGLGHPQYWAAWIAFKDACIVDDPQMGPCEILENENGVWLCQITKS